MLLPGSDTGTRRHSVCRGIRVSGGRSPRPARMGLGPKCGRSPVLNAEQIELRRVAIIRRCGAWTAHTISLGGGLNTWDRTHPKYEAQVAVIAAHLRRIMQCVADVMHRPLASLRVLDLACLEGLYGIEFARQGAEVVGIEGREANLEKALFAKDVLGLSNLTLIQDDVRNLSVERYGSFDVVLCLGLLYHLDAPDVFHFVERMAQVCRRVAVVDTHVAVRADQTCRHGGREYHGWHYTEHPPGATDEEKIRDLWASLDNNKSFWLTRPSLYNLLSLAGFTSVSTCQSPANPGQWTDRDTLVAVKGQRVELFSTPDAKGGQDELWPEQNEAGLHCAQREPLAAGQARPVSLRKQGLLGRLLRIPRG
jgi:SAM-dependent methyltransferase